jgi:hypothetical protein
VPNAYDNRVVHEYAGWRNQCIGGEFWGNCVGFRTDVGVGTLDVDLLDTTSMGQNFNAYQNYKLVAVDGEPVAGEEWVDLDIRWGQQRSGGAADISEEDFKDILDEQLGLLNVISAGEEIACDLGLGIVGDALCAVYSNTIASILLDAFESQVYVIVTLFVNEEFNGPKTPGAKGDEYFYVGCPTEGKDDVLCPEDVASQESYVVDSVLWGGGNSNMMGDIDGDGKDEIVSLRNGGVIVVKRYVEDIDEETGVISARIAQQVYNSGIIWGGDGYNWLGDFDGDGRDDIISAVGSQLFVREFTDTALGGFFTLRPTYIVSGAVYGSASFTWVADLDGDEKDEVITASAGNIWVKWYHREYETCEACPERGNLIVDEVIQTQLLTANQWSSSGFSWTGDIDGDGRDEILSAIFGTIVVRRFVDIDVPGAIGEIELKVYGVRPDWWNAGWRWAADLDGDGADEVVTASFDSVFVRTFNGPGFGFGEKSIILPGSLWGASNFSWNGDIDGDGSDELVTAVGSTIYVKRFRSIGTGETAP